MKTRHIPNLQALQQIDDYESFTRLNPRVRNMITARLEWILKIEAAGHGDKEKIKKASSIDLGVSVPTVNRFVRDYRIGGWKKLSDGQRQECPSEAGGVQGIC